MKDAERGIIFDVRTKVLDMRKRRTTDLKGNSRVILPRKMRNFGDDQTGSHGDLQGFYGGHQCT